VVAVFPTQTVRLSPAEGKKIGAPRAMTSISVQSVPTSVALGPDGALYVGELTGVPFRPETARVWRVVPGRKPTVYASGFTTISDLAFDGRDLLVLEISTKGLLAGRSPGALIRVRPDGARRVVASKGLLYPTGVAVAGKSIYISNNGVFPATGSGPHGEIVSLTE
jgi:sugar lactone lactonase YvrE